MNDREQLSRDFARAVESLTPYAAKVQNNGNIIVLEKGEIKPAEGKKLSVFAACVSAAAVVFLLSIAMQFLKHNQEVTFILFLVTVGSIYYFLIRHLVFGSGIFGDRRVTIDLAQQKFYIEEPPSAYTIYFQYIKKIQTKTIADRSEEDEQRYGAVEVQRTDFPSIIIESREYTESGSILFFSNPDLKRGKDADESIRESMQPLCDMLEIMIKGSESNIHA